MFSYNRRQARYRDGARSRLYSQFCRVLTVVTERGYMGNGKVHEEVWENARVRLALPWLTVHPCG